MTPASPSPAQVRRGLLLGFVGVVIFAMTFPMTRLAVGDASAPQMSPAFVTAARAALAGRGYVIPDDIKAFVIPALAHRVLLVPDLWMQRRAVEDVLQGIVQGTAVPVVTEQAR